MSTTTPAARRRRPWVKSMLTIGVAVLIGWGCVIGAGEILHSLDVGQLNNRKGPDLQAARHPVVFWALVVFYTAGVLASAGLALAMIAIAKRNLTQPPPGTLHP